MKGVLIEKTGGVDVLQWKTDLPVPTPKEGEVLVKNDFIGINYIDTFVPSPLLTPLLHYLLYKAILTYRKAISAQASTQPPNPKSSAAKQKAQSSQPAPAPCTTSKQATA
jgi:hypothetical protein